MRRTTDNQERRIHDGATILWWTVGITAVAALLLFLAPSWPEVINYGFNR